MKTKYSFLKTALVTVGLVVLMAWAFSSASRPGGLAGRTGLSSNAPAAAGLPAPKPYGVEVIYPAATGEIASLKDVKAVEPLLPAIAKERDENTHLPKVPTGPERVEVDRAVQSIVLGPNMPSPLANFDGLGLSDQTSTFSPPDTNGDIGYDPATGKHYYFQWINVTYKAWDVTNPAAPVVVVPTTQGNVLWAAALPGSTCATTNDGDPIALFDEQAQRWFISQFSVSSPFHQCVAVSKTADPSGAWWVYDYAYRDGTTYFNDYPHFGVWPDATYNAYFMTMHQFNAAGTAWLGQAAAAFDRASLLNGTAAPMVLFDLNSVNANFGGMLAADLDGTPPPAGTPGFFFEVDDSTYIGPSHAMRIWEFRPNWATPAASTFGVSGQPNYTLTVSSFNLLCATTQSCVPQSGTTNRLDGLADRLMHRVAFRVHGGGIQSAMLNHTVDAGSARAGVRWYEVQRDPATGAWSINQQSTYAPADSVHRWMGSIAMDRSGNIALGYSASSSTQYAAIRYAGRLSSDPLSTLPQTEVTMTVSTGPQTSSTRWGDYSMLGVDPQDGCTFWYTQEYHGASGLNWKTRIGSFKFPSCAGGVVTGTVTNANTNAPISGASIAAISPLGDSGLAVSNASGTYAIDLAPGTYTVTASALGYNSSTTTGVSVSTGATTTVNFALAPLPQADLVLTKTASTATTYVGGPVTYTLLVANNGPDSITTTITLTDTLPVSFSLSSATGSGWTCLGTATVVCTRTGLSNGASTSVSLVGTAPSQVGVYANTATVTSALADLNAANNTSSVNLTVAPQTDLAITKAGPAAASPSATLVYTLNVTNNGPLTIGQSTTTYTNSANITIVDNAAASPYPSVINVPTGAPVQKVTASLQGISHTYPSDIDIILVGPTGAKSWLLSDVIGSTDISNFNLTFDDAAASTIGCPTVTTPVSGTYKPTDCTDTIGTDIFPAPAPAGSYAASLAQFNGTESGGAWNLYVRDDAAGDTGRITSGWGLALTTGYNGPITVTDTLPAGTTFVGASGAGWSCSQAGGVVTCTRSDLAAGASSSVLVTVTAPASAGTITNTATVASPLADAVSGNNTAQATTAITGASNTTLSINTVGSGSVAKNPDQPAYTPGTIVTLTATPISGWSFAGWSGDLSGSTNPASVTMNADKVITATFTQNVYTPTITIVGNGSVTRNPNQANYTLGQVVTLTAVPTIGWTFAGWSGDVAGSANPIALTIDANPVVTATFTQDAYALTINTVGSGTVSKNPNLATYHYGDVVTLTATPAGGWNFANWSGALTGTTNPSALTITGAASVTATFTTGCVPITSVGFGYAPLAPVADQAVQFTAVITGGMQPITYTWNFGHGNDVVTTTTSLMHSFPVTNVIQIYPVTLSAANACSNVAAPSQNVTVTPLSLYLPLLLK